MSTWTLEPSPVFGSKTKQYKKKHPVETVAVLSNLDTYKKALDSGVKPAFIQAGFIHQEPKGVVAIDQKGIPKEKLKGKPRQTRLYIYAYELDQVIHLITIGDKKTQKQDIEDCKKFVDRLRKET